MSKEVFRFRQVWAVDAPPQEQTVSQNFAEDRFNYLIEKIKHAGGTVSPVKRTMRTLKDEDERDYMMLYDQRILVTASEEIMATLKDMVKDL